MILFTGVLLCIVPFLYRWSGSLLVAGSGIYVYATVLVATVTWDNGGAGSALAAWHVLIPMGAMPVVGIPATVFWGSVAVLVNGAFWVLTSSGHAPPNLFRPEMLAFAATMSNMGLAAVATGMGLIHERAKTDAVSTLASANRWLLDARKHAERAGRAKSHFLANISHELRTPLTAILGFADLLIERWRGRGVDMALQESLRTIRRSGHHLLEVINDLLDLAKIESGSLGIESIDFDPAQLIAQVVRPLRRRAEEKGLALATRLDTPLPGRIQGDPTRVTQILLNLVGNAIKFTQEGRVAVVASAIERENGGWLRIDIQDTGCGIAAEHLPSLFTPFHQVDDSATREHGGSGLGLALCRQLADLMGGRMEVTSTLGVGSVFALELPLRAVSGSGSVRALPDQRPVQRGPRPPLELRLLLAEDGPDNRRLIARVLREAGADVDIVENGQLAVEQALAALGRGEPHDLILMDMEMPVLDGAGAARALRDAGFENPIVALTAHSPADERKRCLAAGFNEIATKPIDWTLLLELIAQLCAKPRTGD